MGSSPSRWSDQARDRSRLRGQEWLPFHPTRRIPRVRRYGHETYPQTLPADENAKESLESDPFRIVWIMATPAIARAGLMSQCTGYRSRYLSLRLLGGATAKRLTLYPSNSPSSGVCSPTERNASATAPGGLL